MKYLVFTEDEYFNNYWIGVFNNLENAIPEINKWLEVYNTRIDELNVAPSTYDFNFDKEIQVDELTYVYVRGFILSDKDLKAIDE